MIHQAITLIYTSVERKIRNCICPDTMYHILIYFENPANREEGYQIIVTKSHEQVNKEKKERTQNLTRFGNLLTSSR